MNDELRIKNIINKTICIVVFSVILYSIFTILTPVASAAGLRPFGGPPQGGGKFPFLLIGLKNLIHFVLFYLAFPLAAISFLYAGFLLITQGASESARGKAKKIFGKVILGLIVALAAWLIVNVVLEGLGVYENCPDCSYLKRI